MIPLFIRVTKCVDLFAILESPLFNMVTKCDEPFAILDLFNL